jgi:DNA-binding MarR family transcriptional regulator
VRIEPEEGLLGRIVRLNLAVTRALDDITARAGITFADYLVLGVVRRSPGRRSAPGTIAEVLDRTTGGMSLTLDRLEAAGYLRRSRDARDGRRVVVTLTPRGLRVATSVNRALHRWEGSLALPAGGKDVAVALDALTAAVRTHPRAEPAWEHRAGSADRHAGSAGRSSS